MRLFLTSPRPWLALLAAALGIEALATALHLAGPVPPGVSALDAVALVLAFAGGAGLLLLLASGRLRASALGMGILVALAGALAAALGPAWRLASSWRMPLLALSLALGLAIACWPRREARLPALAAGVFLFAAEAGLSSLPVPFPAAALVGAVGAALGAWSLGRISRAPAHAA